MDLKHLNAASIELEIRKALLDTKDVEMAADHIIKQFAISETLTLTDIESISNFLMNCGLYVALNDFLTKQLEVNRKIPWAILCESLFASTSSIEPEVIKFLIEGAEVSRQLEELSRSKLLDHFEPELVEQRKNRLQKRKSQLLELRQKMLAELETFRSQNLMDAEEELLQRLLNYFPQDDEALKLKNALREKRALGVYVSGSRAKANKLHQPLFDQKDSASLSALEEIDVALKKESRKSKSLLADFAMIHLFWEEDERALKLLENAPSTPSIDWLKAELYLRSRQFNSLLEFLIALEVKYASDSESIYAIHYLRAQALWGLNQKYAALEMMQILLEQQPDYRAAHSFVEEWKDDIG